MKGESQIDITFISGDDLIGSTVEELSEQDLADLRTNTMYQVQEVMATAEASDLFEGDFDGHDVFAFISPLGTHW
jgi:hypothetical protein